MGIVSYFIRAALVGIDPFSVQIIMGIFTEGSKGPMDLHQIHRATEYQQPGRARLEDWQE